MKNVLDYILFIPNALPLELCDDIVNEYKDSTDWALGYMGDTVKTDLRNCSTLDGSSPEILMKNKDVRWPLNDRLTECVAKAISQYLEKFPSCDVADYIGYTFLRYATNEFIKTHIDAGRGRDVQVSCSIGLNDGYEGGEFSFFDEKHIVKLEKGSILLFPSNFMYPHEVLPVTSGTRYSIITWFN